MCDKAPEYLIISASQRPSSLSRLMADNLRRTYETLRVSTVLLDLRDFVLPLCDGGPAYAHPHVASLSPLIQGARVIIVATPIYNFDATAVTKSLIELTGRSWENKIVGFLCAAGGGSSYMSIMSLANSLMLDFRCLVIPRFVYAKADDFSQDKRPATELDARITQLAILSTTIRVG